jgi:hypothetical protein
MIPFVFLYGGGRISIVDGDRDIRHRHSAHVVIIHIIWLAVFVFLGGQSEELDQTKAQWHYP